VIEREDLFFSLKGGGGALNFFFFWVEKEKRRKRFNRNVLKENHLVLHYDEECTTGEDDLHHPFRGSIGQGQ